MPYPSATPTKAAVECAEAVVRQLNKQYMCAVTLVFQSFEEWHKVYIQFKLHYRLHYLKLMVQMNQLYMLVEKVQPDEVYHQLIGLIF